ncbi:RNA polymerase sigma factor [Streptomyces sp. NPDC020983]|uniref:RNA polymerase sigma factor n=1 Tax=Streptomyces sp. NPDC020983 TaxID=3365106 RepID=UPI0037A9B743
MAGRGAPAALLEAEGISDEQLLEMLRACGLHSPLGQKVYQRLLRYELAALTSWMSSGLIWHKIAALTRAKSGAVYTGRSNWSAQEADELRKDTVAQGLLELDKIVFGGWDPALGAGLKTYFTNRCLWIFLNNYKKLLRTKKIMLVPLEEAPLAHHSDPQDVVVARETAREALSKLPAEMQMILQLRAEDYTNREIAELVGITEKAVEGRLHRYYERNQRGGYDEQ